MTNSQTYLSYNQTLFFKGIAILCILLHNFFHLLAPVTYQNEMFFAQKSVFRFIQDFSFSESINALFSFFGFYGVYVFIFLSGYGLSKAFTTAPALSGFRFTVKHALKVYKLFLISVGLYVLYVYPDVNFKALLHSLSLTNNFFADRVFLVNGPWWFFSLIIQLYVVFTLLYYFLKRGKAHIFYIFYVYLILACFLIYNGGEVIEFYANFPGHLPEFSLGIYIALYEKELSFLYNRRINALIAATAFVMIIGAQFFKFLFVLSFTASAIFAFSFFLALDWRENKFLQYTGKISPYLFGFNGFLFRHYFVSEARLSDNAFSKICYCGCWLILNYLVATFFCRLFTKKATSTTLKP